MSPIPDGAALPTRPATFEAVRRGLLGRCPVCGQGRIFPRFLRVADRCPACAAELHHQRADDFPPYIVIFIVGHVVGYGIYQAESHVENIPLWVHGAIWPALTILLCLLLLQPVKGAVVGLQYGLGMHGFGHQGAGSAPVQPAREAVGGAIAGTEVAGAAERGRP